MKIMIFGVAGNAGRALAAEALERGHEVVGVVRNPAAVNNPDARIKLVQGDACDAVSVASVVRGAGAVINAISPRPSSNGPAPSLVAAARSLMNGAKRAGVSRLLVVGGAGSLKGTSGIALIDTPGFPDIYKPEASAHRDSLEVYRQEGGELDWTYISPALVFDGVEKKGAYRTSADTLIMDAEGNSAISFPDYATAMLDELERPSHLKQRFAVAY